MIAEELISSENFSQSSTASRVSNLSDLEIEIPSRPRTKRSFPFTDVGPKAKSIRTKEIFEHLLETADKENISPERLAAYLGYRVSYLNRKKISKTFKDIFDEEEEETKVDIPQALFIREHCQIGRGVYTDLRLALKNKTILPPHNLLSNLETELLPVLEVFEHGWKVNLQEAVSKTLERWFLQHENLQKEYTSLAQGIQCFFSGGCDGSGGHSVYNSASSLADNVDTSHMLFAGFALTEVRALDSDKTIFKDSFCNSSNAERPWVLIPGKESRENFAKVIKVIDKDVNEITSSELNISGIRCKISFDLSQLEGKAIVVASGLGGCYCTSCKVSEADAKLPERIQQGFTIDRNIDELHSLYMVLAESTSSGEIEPVPGDYRARTGLTNQPLTIQDVTKNIPITHAYLRSLSYFETLIYQINADVRIMGKGKRLSTDQRDRLTAAKEKFRKDATHGPLHLRLDQPDSHGHGGNSDTGPMARAFFSQEKSTDVLDLVNGTGKTQHYTFLLLYKPK